MRVSGLLVGYWLLSLLYGGEGRMAKGRRIGEMLSLAPREKERGGVMCCDRFRRCFLGLVLKEDL